MVLVLVLVVVMLVLMLVVVVVIAVLGIVVSCEERGMRRILWGEKPGDPARVAELRGRGASPPGNQGGTKGWLRADTICPTTARKSKVSGAPWRG